MSVALCTHNGRLYIEEQLRSILGQVPAPMQLVVSDDASSDGTLDVVRRLAAESDVEVDVLVNPVALGVTANFERAVRACTGDIIVLSDQDDVWHEGRLARAVEVLEARADLDLVASDAQLVDATGARLPLRLLESLGVGAAELEGVRSATAFHWLMKRNVVTGATVAFRRRLLERALPFPAAWVHDEWLAAIAAATARIDLLPEPLIDYRQHGANQIGVSRPTLRDKIGRLLEPRRERNERLAARARVLAERLDAAVPPVPAEVRQAAWAKVEHEELRRSLPSSRIRRLPAVLGEARSGAYSRSGRGMQDALRDLVQPDR